MTDLLEFTSELMEHNGGLIERGENQLEVILPPETARMLEIPEHSRLRFSMEEEKPGIAVMYDSEVFNNMSRLLEHKGRYCFATMPFPEVRIEKLMSRIPGKVVLNNAVYSVDSNEVKPVSYLLSFVKFTAISDEKREGIIASLVNELTLSQQQMNITDATGIFTSLTEGRTGSAARKSDENSISALYCFLQTMAAEELGDFIESMARRLNRDVHRIYEYYRSLTDEIQQQITRKMFSGEEKEKQLSRINAVETEREWKIQDMLSKYSLNIELEPVSFIRIEAPVPVFWLTIKRRKESRRFPLTYNPILKTLDNLPCESCFTPGKSYYVCDERLHLICSRCYSKCEKCAKEYCPACHPKGCPKCGKK